MTSFLRAKWRVYVLRLVLLAVILGLWEYKTRVGGTSAVILPPISDVTSRLWELLQQKHTWSAAWITLVEGVAALAIAIVLGFAVGFLASRTVRRAAVFQPVIGAFYLVPAVLFFPMFELWFGVGLTAKIAYAAANSFLPIAYNTITGFCSVDDRYVRVASAFRASRLQSELWVKLPASLPMVLAGVRVGAAASFISVVLGETLAANRGLGSELTLSSQILDSRSTFAYIILIVVLVALVQMVINRVLDRRRHTSGSAVRSGQ